MAKLGLSHEAFTLRMTGCPNACARPYNSDIGIVGRTLGKYTIFLGGRLLGDRLNEQYKDVVPFEDLSQEITAVLACYKAERKSARRSATSATARASTAFAPGPTSGSPAPAATGKGRVSAWMKGGEEGSRPKASSRLTLGLLESGSLSFTGRTPRGR